MARKQGESPIVLILGAGASVPLGMSTTVGLRKTLCDDTLEGRAAAEIHRSAAYRFRIGADDINIEDFLEHLYELQLMLWLARHSELPQLLPGFTASEAVTAEAGNMLAQVHRRVYRLLHETCGDCSGRKADRLWRAILDGVAGGQTIVPIFTLNYDWTFEKLAIESGGHYRLADGFELLGGSWDTGRLANIKPVRGKINIALYKLHGSTNWLPGGPVKSMGSFAPADDAGQSGYPPHQFEMIYPGHAHERWFGDEYWGRLNDATGVFGPWAEREPYKTLHAHLHTLLPKAHRIVIIGYAFHDKIINAALGAALDANARLQVLVVDPGIPRYVKRTDTSHRDPPFEFLKLAGEHEFPWSRFTWLEGRFGEKAIADAMVTWVTAA
jgi:hypothetical protein